MRRLFFYTEASMKQVLFTVVFLIVIGLRGAYSGEVRAVDTNGDGAPDQWFYNDGPDLVKMEEDLDLDGTVDKRAEFFYENGEKKKVQIDSNMDGKPDGWSYHKSGVRYRVESDTNYDGAADYVIDHEANVITIDSDHDGKMDIERDGRYDIAELERWLVRERPDYAAHLQRYMKNTDYKRKAGL
jgi:hypothetical protein